MQCSTTSVLRRLVHYYLSTTHAPSGYITWCTGMVSTAFRPWWTTFLAVTFLVWSGHGGQIVWLLTGGIESAAPVFGFACETVRTLSHSPQCS